MHEERRALEEAQWLNRAHLLRDFEATTLTRANFCALKGVADEELDGLLEIARGEKKEYEARRPGPDQARREGPRPPQGDRRPPSRERRPAPTGDEARKPR